MGRAVPCFTENLPAMTLIDPRPTDDFDVDGSKTPADAWDRHAAERALDELFTQTTTFRTGPAFRDLMGFIAAFRFYAPFNAMLVYIQKPGARYVAPAHRWLKLYGRRIKPGAQPLVILQPMGPVMFVFDVSDTEGAALPEDVENPFAVRHIMKNPPLARTIANAARDGIRVTPSALGSQQAGSIGRTKSPSTRLVFREQIEVPLRYELVLNSNHEPSPQYATLVHELGHLYCGHLGTPDDRWWPDRRGLATAVEEFEAESVAYLVCRRAGIEPKSDEYLSAYLEPANNGDVPPISLECVVKAAGLIEQMGKENLRARKTG
jgi:hypothetical protein